MRRRSTTVLSLLGAVALLGVAAATTGAMTAATTLKATLTGAAEVPSGDRDGSGKATVKVSKGKVCWELSVRKIAKPTAAHIHKGKAGTAGPVVVSLGKSYKSKGCQSGVKAATIRAIKSNPRGHYVNVHNGPYPNGAVRGQLKK